MVRVSRFATASIGAFCATCLALHLCLGALLDDVWVAELKIEENNQNKGDHHQAQPGPN